MNKFVSHNSTPTTDPGDYVVEANAELTLKAGEEIHLKPGVHFKAGATFHAKMDPQVCGYCTYSGIPPYSDGRHPYTTNSDYENDVQTDLNLEASLFKIYPNPSTTTATIEIVKEDVSSFN
ncbi:MAG TPA: hypothetical protein PLI97_08355 [Fluviicola sp.]|nr:hypothetical protein [Fluviicola sp.]